MGLRNNPSQRQLRIGAELRRLRDEADMTAAEAGTHAGIGSAHLGHMEAGRTGIPDAKLRALTDAYGVKADTYVQALLAMNQGTGRGWWSDYKREVSPRARDLAELECMSSSQRVFDLVYMPGLLQTPEYMKALFASEAPDLPPDAADAGQRFRVKRQEVLTQSQPPNYHAIIHEAAFHMGFISTEVMQQQLAHLIEVATLPHVTIQVLPFKSRAFPAVGTPFTVFGAEVAELSTVYLEHDAGSVFFGDQGHLRRYGTIFDQLSAVALPPLTLEPERQFHVQRDSFALLQHLAYTL